jgi:hypothetical protein
MLWGFDNGGVCSPVLYCEVSKEVYRYLCTYPDRSMEVTATPDAGMHHFRACSFV